MHVSVFMGPMALTAAQDGPLIDQCLDLAERSAAAGFAMVTFGEQHFNDYEPYSNPFLMGARLAPVLGDAWFGTTIVPLPFHDVVRLAEDSSVLDVLTRGRFVLGMSSGRVGIGSDFGNFHVDAERREEVFASKLDLLGQLYARKAGGPPLEIDTDWDRATVPGRLMPAPFRDGGPQLAIGTNTDSKIDDVARRGLALFLGPCAAPAAAAKMRRHREALAAAGYGADLVADRAAKSLVTRHVIVAGTSAEAWEAAEVMAGRAPMMDRRVDRRTLRELSEVPVAAVADDPFPRNVAHVHDWISAGTPDSVTGQLLRYADLGVRHVNVRFTVGTYRPELVERSFRLFTDEVLPALSPERFAAPTPDETGPEHRPGVDVLAAPARTRPAGPPPGAPAPAPVLTPAAS